jgi:formamidopyrimidine-DNA glycosylase
MIDMVEARVIAGQIAEHLLGEKVRTAELAARKKKSMRDAFLLRVKPDEFRARLEGATLTDAYAKYRHVCIETDSGFGLDVWDIYGKILYIAKGAKIPGNPPISLGFEDGSHLIVLPGVWGAMRVPSNEELRAFRDSSNPDILDTSSEAFTVAALKRLIGMEEFQGSHIKQVITKHGSPGLMSMMGAYSQEALYRAHIHPKRKAQQLTEEELVSLHRAVHKVTHDAIRAGGRASERDLFNQPGDFVPTVSQATEGKPCPVCGAAIKAINMGGAGKYYICPGCQVL